MTTPDTTLRQAEQGVAMGSRSLSARLSARWLLAAGVVVAWTAGSAMVLSELPPAPATEQTPRALDVATPESVAALGQLVLNSLRRGPR